jgi:WD40 repeat protein
MNAQKYLDNFNVMPIFEKILKKHNINKMEVNYNRHLLELKKKYLSLMSTFIHKNYFNEMPLFYEEPLLYLIILNTPFINEEKREKYKLFLKAKVFNTFKDCIKEYIFPYKNSDEEKLGNNAILILKMESLDLTTKVAEEINGKKLDKTHTAIAIPYYEYEKIANLPNKFEEKKQTFDINYDWEKSNFTEMLLVESKDKITVGTVHFLKKNFTQNYTLPNTKDINGINWSPQGKYLVINKNDKIILYGGENDQPLVELDVHSHNYSISNDENYIVTFSGYPNEKEIERKKQEKKKALEEKKRKKEEKKKLKEEKKKKKKEKKEEDDEEEEEEDDDEEEEEEEDEEEEMDKGIENIFIRDIINNKLLRSFSIDKSEKFADYIWSPDSKFIGRINSDRTLIVYELPLMKMILDKEGSERRPIKNNVNKFSWFPNNNILIAISEKYDPKNKKKLISSTLDFIEIPSRETFPSSSLSNSNIIDLVWHKNNHLLAILSKDNNKNNYSVRLIDFNIKNRNFSSSNCKLAIATKEKQYITEVKICWMGDVLFVVPKFKEINVETISVYPYNLNKQNLELEPWPQEKSIDSLKHSHFIPSPNGLIFLLSCMDKNNTNNYGKCDSYILFGGKISLCVNADYGAALSKLEWDHDGRLYIAELNYGKEKEGFRIINCLGDTVLEVKDLKLTSVSWRPRHKPVLSECEEDKEIENNYIKISKVYEDEDSEFLSIHEKKQRALDKQVYDKFTAVMKRRLERYNKDKDKKERKEEKKIAHAFWIEEILKGEEYIIDSQEY